MGGCSSAAGVSFGVGLAGAACCSACCSDMMFSLSLDEKGSWGWAGRRQGDEGKKRGGGKGEKAGERQRAGDGDYINDWPIFNLAGRSQIQVRSGE